MTVEDTGLLAQGHRTVDRVAAILEAAATAEPVGVRLGTIADQLDAPKSSIHGLLKGLVAVGYLAERQGAYFLGPALHALLGRVEKPTLSQIALASMEELATEFDETVLLGHRMGNSIVYLSAVECQQLIRYSPALAQRRPVLPTSMGKIYVANLNDQEMESYLEANVPNRRRRRSLTTELETVRQTHVAINRNETLPGLCGVAAGIRRHGELVGCISIVGPSERLIPRLKRVTKAVLRASEVVSNQLA